MGWAGKWNVIQSEKKSYFQNFLSWIFFFIWKKETDFLSNLCCAEKWIRPFSIRAWLNFFSAAGQQKKQVGKSPIEKCLFLPQPLPQKPQRFILREWGPFLCEPLVITDSDICTYWDLIISVFWRCLSLTGCARVYHKKLHSIGTNIKWSHS